MNFKKLVAAILATAMVMTSSSFAEVIMAADINDTVLTENEAQPATEVSENEAASGQEVIQEQAEEPETPAEEPEAADAEDEKAVQKEEVKEAEPEEEDTLAEEPAAANEEGVGNEAEEAEEENEDELMDSSNFFVLNNGVLEWIDGSGKDFYGTVSIPADCEEIPENFFKDNKKITGIIFEKSYVDDQGDVQNKQLLTTIGANAFANSAISYISNFPSTLEEIPTGCFNGSDLDTITFMEDSNDTLKSKVLDGISTGIKTIGENAFQNVQFYGTYPTLTFKNCETIGANAFRDSNINKIYFDGKIREIGDNAFDGCSKLNTFDADGNIWSSTITKIGKCAFKGTAFTSVDLKDVDPEEVNGVKSIAEYAFQNCTKLDTFTFPQTATIIDKYLLAGCTSLKTVNLPEVDNDNVVIEGVTTIKECAFQGCSALESIDLREAYHVDSYAFDSCPKLKMIIFGYKRAEVVDAGHEDDILVEDTAFFTNLKPAEKKNYTLKGFDDDYLSQYADDHLYTYVTRNTKYTITKSTDPLSQYAKCTMPATALENEVVSVKVIPDKGRSVSAITITKENGGNVDYKVVVANTAGVMITFVMPKGNVTIKPETMDIDKITINDTNLVHTLNDVETGVRAKTYQDGVYAIASTGESYKFNIVYRGRVLPNWVWKFESANPSVVSVTQDGIVSSIGAGRTMITVSLINSSAKSFTVNFEVEDEYPIGEVYVRGKDYPEEPADPDDPKKWDGGIIQPEGKVKEKPTISTRKVTIAGVDYEYPVVSVRRSSITNGNLSFDVNVDAFAVKTFDANGDPVWVCYPDSVARMPVITKTNWSSSDPTIATVSRAESTTNNNTITIKQNSYGEAAICITVLNEGEKKVNEEKWEKNETFVIVQVWDDTPRIDEKEITINAQKEENWVTLINAYNTDIKWEGMSIYSDIRCTKKLSDLEVHTYQLTKEADLEADPKVDPNDYNDVTDYNHEHHDQMINIITSEKYDNVTPLNKTNTYKGLYLKCERKNGAKPYVIPLPVIKVINTQPNPTIKTVNKFNLFYKPVYDPGNDPDETGVIPTPTTGVYFTQSVTTEKVDTFEVEEEDEQGEIIKTKWPDITFISKENNNKYGSTRGGNAAIEKVRNKEVTDKFHDNFTVLNDVTDAKNNIYFPIRRNTVANTQWEINVDSSKTAITAGFIYIRYVGYKYPVKKAYTVPTEVKAPSYALNQTAQTASTKAKGQEYRIWLYDTLDKTKSKVDLSGLCDVDGDGHVSENGLAIDKNKTKNTSVDKAQVRNHVDDDEITIKIKNTPAAGLVSVRLHMKTWSDYKKDNNNKFLWYNYTLRTTMADPTAKFTPATAKFNIAYRNEYPTIKATMTQPTEVPDLTMPIKGFKQITYKGNAKYAEDIKENGAIIIHSGDSEGATFVLDDTDPGWKNTVASPAGDDNGRLTFEIADDENGDPILPKGNYAFTVVPVVRLVGATKDLDLKAIPFTVSLTEAKPRMVLKTPTFSLNYSDFIVDSDNVYSKSSFTIANLPAGSDNRTMDMSRFMLSGGEIVLVPKGEEIEDVADVEIPVDEPLTLNNRYMLAKRAGETRAKGFTYRYKVTGMELEPVNAGDPVPRKPLDDFLFTISGFVRKPTLTVKASGSINFVDIYWPLSTTSRIMYTATLKDVQDEINHIRLTEFIEGEEYNSDEDPDKMHFGIYTHDDDDDIPAGVAYVYIQEPNGLGDNPGDETENFRLKPGAVYNIALNYTADGNEGDTYEYRTTIRPTQTP